VAFIQNWYFESHQNIFLKWTIFSNIFGVLAEGKNQLICRSCG